MKNLEFGNKKELEQVLVEYMCDNDEDMSLKFTGLYYKFHIMHKKNKYHVNHAKQDYQFNTIFDLANYMFIKCDFKLDNVPTTVTTKEKPTTTVTTTITTTCKTGRRKK